MDDMSSLSWYIDFVPSYCLGKQKVALIEHWWRWQVSQITETCADALSSVVWMRANAN